MFPWGIGRTQTAALGFVNNRPGGTWGLGWGSQWAQGLSVFMSSPSPGFGISVLLSHSWASHTPAQHHSQIPTPGKSWIPTEQWPHPSAWNLENYPTAQKRLRGKLFHPVWKTGGSAGRYLDYFLFVYLFSPHINMEGKRCRWNGAWRLIWFTALININRLVNV